MLDLGEFLVPDFVLDREERCDGGGLERVPRFPLLVFVNAKSGGQLGIALLETFSKLLASHQVFDLSKVDPREVLSRVSKNLEAENDVAKKLRNSLRIVVAGGDGTAGWLLGTASDVSPHHPFPIATIPLGTGNNLPFSFGWGKFNPGTDARSMKKFLKQVLEAHFLKVDRWQLTMTMEGEPDMLPHSIQKVPRIEETNEAPLKFRGGFWNYFSIGMDAQVSYEFHKQRRENPEKFNSQLRNQCAYATLGCTQGWFCAPFLHPSSRSINEIATVYTADFNGPWKKLPISSSIRSLVLLNLPSFSGGLDPWGTPNDRKSIKRGLTSPSVEDGLLEIVGFRDGWHGLFLLFPKGHGTRLAQAHEIKIELQCRSSSRSNQCCTYMRMDGEPWKQRLEKDRIITVEICHKGQGAMLARQGCIAERKDAYRHALTITKHGLEHGLKPKSNCCFPFKLTSEK
ncbi:hypothetical protein SELMODRAFT_135099 [Selaginella moellendorffii]|uniref:Diacylglycerol kinase n=1 Tax=Selaginella moellendorffii TaxID=88036 RepID=D8T9S0_SELML|nr:diacylglycerol kinase 5 [Selaginella moellendorffii]EFJ06602.1 hypothetical protein SELMODRAFT_135099 [Selaginella moellendorffii]|eukprot:XP_002992326.1 diacylglycerol kinase 5 [Selaginella moellendorffii]